MIKEAVKSGELAHLVKGVRDKMAEGKGKEVNIVDFDGKVPHKRQRLEACELQCVCFSPTEKDPLSNPLVVVAIVGTLQTNRAYIDTVAAIEIMLEKFFNPKGGVKFLLVAIDYFTKWPEVKPLAKITGKQVIDFVWENIICRYGLPGVLVTDNGKQFAEKPFSVWCKEFRIAQVFSSVAYPQSNGQVERMNRGIVEGIKARLGRYESNWLEELPSVLWA
ncbi:uncharacterized protein LOC110919148 [Helianthus annuus]|uniref:uncharacterized protein LOC110919148 n=1 Tax=Helianthus annuus TaxID=4232 RepID=UPI000B906619|nr:uncharacterized protein LOC110919148 [Helianthus annuus]